MNLRAAGRMGTTLTRDVPRPGAGDSLPISAFIICQNEDAYIGACIESLRGCAEIVVVDSGSTDGTIARIQAYAERNWPIRLFHQNWLGYAAQKQFALEQCGQDWCFNIDSDERLDAPLRAALPRLMAAPDAVVGWRVARRPYLLGYGYTPENVRERKNLRLIRRGKGRYDLTRAVHEGIVPDGEVRDCAVGSILHYRPLIIDEQILKENRYSTLKADQHVAEGKRPSSWKLIFNPPVYFLRLYFKNGLWRCGLAGFIEAMTGGVYAFLTQAKIYQRYALRQHPNEDNWMSAPAGTKDAP
jgi:glycosyltransferase involved in cell wall biosynthesis